MKISLIELKSVLKSKALWLTAIGLFAFPVVYEMLPVRLDITQDVSLKQSVWITEFPFDQEKHQYMLFLPPVHNQYTMHAKHLLKQISCLPGQELNTTEEGEFFCGGRFVGKAMPTDIKGVSVAHFSYSGVIPEGKYFVTGTHERSYDSKYFGFVDKTFIERGAIPLW